MADNIYSVSEIVGSSTESVDAAIRGAVARAGRTLHNLDWFEVTDIRGKYRCETFGTDSKKQTLTAEIQKRGDAYLVRWEVRGGLAYIGTGIRQGDTLSVAHGPGVVRGEPDGLLDPDVLAGLGHRHADLAVPEVRRGHGNRLDPGVGGHAPRIGDVTSTSGYMPHRLFGCLVGTATIVLVAYIARRVAGARVGLVAACIAAVYLPLIAVDA